MEESIEMQRSISDSGSEHNNGGGTTNAMSRILVESDEDDSVFGLPPERRPGEESDEDRADIGALMKRQDDAGLSVLLKPCLAEFLATMLFVFVGVLSVYNSSSEGEHGPHKLALVALAHGLAIFVLISITGHVR